MNGKLNVQFCCQSCINKSGEQYAESERFAFLFTQYDRFLERKWTKYGNTRNLNGSQCIALSSSHHAWLLLLKVSDSFYTDRKNRLSPWLCQTMKICNSMRGNWLIWEEAVHTRHLQVVQRGLGVELLFRHTFGWHAVEVVCSGLSWKRSEGETNYSPNSKPVEREI